MSEDASSRFAAAEAVMLAAHNLAAVERHAVLDTGERVRVLVAGAGPPVLLLPGLGMVAAGWSSLMARLSGHRLYAVERPGCGPGDPFDLRGLDLRTWATRFADSVVRGLGLERPSLVGNSIGGTSALWYAAAHPERVDRLVTIGAPPFVLDAQAPFGLRLLTVGPIGKLAFRRSSADGIDRMFTGMGHPRAAVTPELRELALASRALPHYRDGFLGLLRAATGLRGRLVSLPEPELSRVAAPTLLIWGANDTHGQVETGRRMTRVMRDARLEVRGAGHLPWLDDPDGCASLINDFLTRPLVSGAGSVASEAAPFHAGVAGGA